MAFLKNKLAEVIPALHRLNRYLFHWNFYRIHLTYFVLVIILASVILYGSNTSYHLKYSDAIFLCASAMTNTGLNTVNLDVLTAWQQALIFLLMPMGDLTVVTITVVFIRKHYFKKRLQEFVEQNRVARQLADDIEKAHHDRGKDVGNGEAGGVLKKLKNTSSNPERDIQNGEAVLNGMRQRKCGDASPPSPQKERQYSHTQGYGGFPAPWETKLFRKFSRYPFRRFRGPPSMGLHHYISFNPSFDHKGRFHSLTEAQMQELGGVEYRALKLLSWLLPAYWFFCLIVVMLFLLPYTTRSDIAGTIRNVQPGELNPQWWAFFNCVSSYSNTGLDLLEESMIPWADTYFILIISGASILVGNTLYPVFLRGIIWTLSKIVPKTTEIHHSLMFLLYHPRRCYLLLFPQKNTWYLLVIQVGINLLAWVLFIILNIGQTAVTTAIPNAGQRVMDGLYQAHGIRAAGFTIITISDVAPALQIFYMAIMYISAYPFIMSVRQTNIYEERSLGIDDSEKSGTEKSSSGSDMLASHIRKQLAYDLWWLLLALFLICIIERHHLNRVAPGFTIFSVLFEVVSAYGTVGLSLGIPSQNYSFCGAWSTLSKLILILVMLRGRHRILPAAVDRAVLLPGQGLMERLDRELNGQRLGAAQERKIREVESGQTAETQEGKVDPEDREEEEDGQTWLPKRSTSERRRRRKSGSGSGSRGED